MTDKITDGLNEEVLALFDGADLTEETKQKISVIFEAAVSEKVKAGIETEKAQLIEQYDTLLEAAKQEIAEEYEEKIDEYISYVAQEWLTENKLAVEQGIRLEIAESFIADLKDLFEAHNVEVPESKVDLFAEMTEKLEAAEKSLNEQIQRNVELTKTVQESKRREIVAEMIEGLSDAQAEKFKSLSEDVPFVDVESFKQKIGIIKEAVGRTKPSATKQVDNHQVIEEETKVDEIKTVIVEEVATKTEPVKNEFGVIASVLAGRK